MSTEPLVSVITPVSNGLPYLSECIESVLAQSYRNWEYIVVDNCSTDGTAEFVERYASKDPRIRSYRNRSFVSLAENHNVGFSLVSSRSRYCKYVHADDWLYPECLRKMVELAEANPTVGVVGAYGLRDRRVKWTGLPHSCSVISGREVCRRSLLGGFYVFGSPTSLLFRSDLGRGGEPLFRPSPYPAFCDQEACYSSLRDWDFGFVHQVLTYTRLHEGSSTSRDTRSGLNVDMATRLYVLARYGPVYLTEAEYRRRLEKVLEDYYRFLGGQVLGRRDRKFWDYHRAALDHAGCRLRGSRVARAFMAEAASSLFRPARVCRKLRRGLGGLRRKRLPASEALAERADLQ